MAAATDMDVLESRVTRLEEALRAVERRLGTPDRSPQTESVARAIETPPPIDFTLIGKSVLIVGGAYLLRALTEVGFVPQRAGAVLAFVYAMVWIAIADRALARGRRSVALFDAATAAAIAASLIWEATTRFHAFTPIVGSMLTVVAALALLVVAVRRHNNAVALISAAMATFTSIGLAIGTADVLPPAVAVAIVGVVALRLRMESYVTLILAAVSDFLALALVAMASLDRVPNAVAAGALGGIALLWVIAIETRPRWPESIQTAAALIIGAAGASLLAFETSALAILWSVVAVATVGIGRRMHRPQWTLQAPLWALAATIAAFTVEPRTAVLSIVGALTVLALTLTPAAAPRSRMVMLGIVTLIALTAANGLLIRTDPALLAMERSVALAVAAVVLSLLGRVRAEAATLARVVLAFGGLQILLETFRTGRATTIVVALAAYGTAMVITFMKEKK